MTGSLCSHRQAQCVGAAEILHSLLFCLVVCLFWFVLLKCQQVFAWTKQRIKNKNRWYLTSRIVRQLLSNSRWRPLPENCLHYFLENETDKKNTMFLFFGSVSSQSQPQKNAAIYVYMKIYMNIFCAWLRPFSDSFRITYGHYKRVKGKAMKRFKGAPLDTISTQHLHRFLHSPRRLWRPEWPGTLNKTRKPKNPPSKLFHCRALCWQLDLLLVCRSSFFFGAVWRRSRWSTLRFYSVFSLKANSIGVANSLLII